MERGSGDSLRLQSGRGHQGDRLVQGATFVVELPTVEVPNPMLDGTSQIIGMRSEESRKYSPRRRLLLVEDNENTGRVMSCFLGKMGYEVHWANGHAAALAVATCRSFDLVVSDLGLPDASGHDLMRELNDRYGLRGIALSDYGMESDIARSRENGFVEHLVKPVNADKFAAVIRQLLG